MVEEQRVVQAQAGGQDQRDQVEQVELDAEAAQHAPAPAAWSAPSAASTRKTRRGWRSAIQHRGRQQHRGDAPAPPARGRGTAATSDSEACLRSSNCAAVLAAPRVATAPGSCRPVSDTSAVAWSSRCSSRPSTLAASGVPRRSSTPQRCGVARGLDVGEERLEGIGHERADRPARLASVACSVGVAGRRCLARALRRRRWAGSARPGRSRRARRRRRSCVQRRAQRFARPAARPRRRRRRARARSARRARPVRARSCASQRQRGGGHRRELARDRSARTGPAPARPRRPRRRPARARPAASAAAAGGRSRATARGQARRVGEVARRRVDQRRQQETRGQRGGAQAGDGEHRQLLQAVDAGEQEGHVGDAGRDHAGGQRRPQRARVVPRRHAGALVAEEVDRIVLHHADQGEAEGDGDAVHAVEQQRHRAQPGQPAAGQRQRAQQRHASSCGRPATAAARSRSMSTMPIQAGLALRCARRSPRRTRPGRSAAMRAAAVATRGVERGVDRVDAPLLAGRIEARRARLAPPAARAARRGRTRRRAAAAARSPAASASASCSVSSVGSAGSSGSISAAAGEPRSCTRASSASRSVAASKRCGVERRRQQVAVGTQRLGDGVQARVAAVGDQRERGRRPRALRAAPATARPASRARRPPAPPAAGASPDLRPARRSAASVPASAAPA